jgi:hypothetical protein
MHSGSLILCTSGSKLRPLHQYGQVLCRGPYSQHATLLVFQRCEVDSVFISIEVFMNLASLSSLVGCLLLSCVILGYISITYNFVSIPNFSIQPCGVEFKFLMGGSRVRYLWREINHPTVLTVMGV